LQIICVNDGSTDSSAQILQRYAEKNSRIEIINKTNGGLSSARNAAYLYIKGKYTLFVDSDDYLEYDTCLKTVTKAEQSNADIVMFFWSTEFELNSKTLVHLKQMQKYDLNDTKCKISVLCFGDIWNKLWKSDFLINNELFCPEYLNYEAHYPVWKGFILANRIAIVNESLYRYRVRKESIMNRAFS